MTDGAPSTVRYAVASNFEVGGGAVERRFFIGALQMDGQPLSEAHSRLGIECGFSFTNERAAAAVAAGLTEIQGLIGDPRTWVVVEIYPPIGGPRR